MAFERPNQLDRIVKKRSSFDKKFPTRAGSYQIALQGGKIKTSAPGFFAKFDHVYEVRTREYTADCYVDGFGPEFEIIAENGENPVRVQIKFRVYCGDGDQNELVEKLGQSSSPGVEFERLMSILPQSIIRSKIDELVSNFSGSIDATEAEIKSKLESATGLRFETCKISFPDEGRLGPIPIRSVVRARLRFAPDKLKVIVDLTLAPNKQEKLKALATIGNKDSLSKDMEEKIVRYLEEEVDVQQYHPDLEGLNGAKYEKRASGDNRELPTPSKPSNVNINEDLKSILNEGLESKGFRVQEVRLLPDYPSFPERFINHLPLSSKTERQYGGQHIELQSEVQLELEDFAQYLREEPDMVEGPARLFKSTVAKVCFPKQYEDFLITDKENEHWQAIEAELEQKFDDGIRTFGYRVNQILSEPKMRESKFRSRDQHTFDIKDVGLANDYGLHVTLDVSVNMALSNWAGEKLKRKIGAGLDIEKEIHAAIGREVRTHLSKVSPTDYFLNFETPRDGKGKPIVSPVVAGELVKPSIQDELRAAISKTLEKEFDAELDTDGFSDVNIRKKPTDAEIHVQKLMATVQNSSVSVIGTDPLGSPDTRFVVASEVEFKISWKISPSRDGWHLISSETTNLDDIKTQVDLAFEERLKRRTNQFLMTVFSGHQMMNDALENVAKELRNELQNYASSAVNIGFGAIVTIVNLVRVTTIEETKDLKRAAIRRDAGEDIANADYQKLLNRAEAQVEREQTIEKLKTAREKAKFEKLIELETSTDAAKNRDRHALNDLKKDVDYGPDQNPREAFNKLEERRNEERKSKDAMSTFAQSLPGFSNQEKITEKSDEQHISENQTASEDTEQKNITPQKPSVSEGEKSVPEE